jgi:hypothetical protein
MVVSIDGGCTSSLLEHILQGFLWFSHVFSAYNPRKTVDFTLKALLNTEISLRPLPKKLGSMGELFDGG